MADNLPEKNEKHINVNASWLPSELGKGFCVETTLPAVTKEDRAQLLDLIESETVAGESLIGTEFWLRDYIMHPVDLNDDDTGEVVVGVRTVLPQPEGPPVAFVSLGVIKSIGRIAYQQGKAPPFDPPVKVKLKSVPTGRGRRTYKLIPVEG